MARTYGKVLCTIWADEDYLALSQAGRLLYLALISQPDISPAGVLPITVGRWRTYLSSTATRDDVWDVLHELDAARFVVLDEDQEEVWVRALMRVDGRLENSNLRTSITTALTSMRSERLRAAAVSEYERITPARTSSRRPSDAVPNGVATPSGPGRQLQQPAASSHQPSAAAARSTSSSKRLPASAAAAVELLVNHRLTTEVVRSPDRYAARLRVEVPASVPALYDVAEDGDPVAIAMGLLGLSLQQAVTADYRSRHEGNGT